MNTQIFFKISKKLSSEEWYRVEELGRGSQHFREEWLTDRYKSFANKAPGLSG